MKNVSLLLVICFVTSLCIAQESVKIQPNEVLAEFSSPGYFFSDKDFFVPGFYQPYEPGKANVGQFFMAALTLTGYDELDSLFGFLPSYDQTKYPMAPGPLNVTTGLPIDSNGANFNRIWKVYGENIRSVRADYGDNQQIDQPIPSDILAWPARGNAHFSGIHGFSLPDQPLAPFLDRNMNLIYEPLLGDLPIIDAVYPDVTPNELIFFVSNDFVTKDPDDHTFGFEYHFMAFGFACSDDEEINRTIFTKTNIINRTSKPFHDLDLGYFVDYDLGCPDDDYAGCAPEINASYIYNEDQVDGDTDGDCIISSRPIPTFGDFPGVAASIFLNQTMTSSIPSRFNPISARPGVPYSNLETLQLLLNGIEVFHFPDFYLDTVNNKYPDFPSDPMGDHMLSDSIPRVDLRLLHATEIDELLPNEQIVSYMAWFAQTDSSVSYYEQPDQLMTAVPIINDFFESGFESCTQVLEPRCLVDCVWPGDVNNDGRVYHNDFIAVEHTISRQKVGPKRLTSSQDWLPFEANKWNIQLNGQIDYKHADCYGDGQTNNQDRFVFINNYLQQTPDYIPVPPVAANNSASGLHIRFFQDRIFENSGGFSSTIIHGSYYLELEHVDSLRLQGVSYSVYVDTNYFDVDFGTLAQNYNLDFDENQEWNSIRYTDLNVFREDIAVARNSNDVLRNELTMRTQMRISLKSSLRVPDHLDSLFIPFPIYDLHGIDTAGNFVELNYVQDSIFLLKRYSSTNSTFDEDQIKLYPNPTTDVLYVESLVAEAMEKVRIMDLTGRLIQVYETSSNHTQIGLRHLTNGIYLIQVVLKDGRQTVRRIVKQ